MWPRLLSLGRHFVHTKIENEERLVDIFQSIPVVQNDRNWSCRSWLANALAEIERDGRVVGTSELDWRKIEATARRYVDEKTAAGRYKNLADMEKPRPTWDTLENKEAVP